MRKFILCALAVAFSTSLAGQSAREEIKKNTRLSASNFMAYPGPQNKLTPAPDGLRPFYISHYGRHGSHYLISQMEYTYPYECLKRADDAGKLTPLGKDVLRRVEMIRDEACGRLGELTPLGAEQHKQIAHRMFERFPEVFESEARIDARSTIVIRCILSMENALHEFLRLNPQLRITHDASEHDMYYMNQNDPKLWEQKMPSLAKKAYDAFSARHERSAAVLARLVNDTAYINHEMNASRVNYYLFRLASNLQSMELRKKITLYDAFDDEDIYQNWLKENAWWYIAFGASPLNGDTHPFLQRNLLRTIIEQTDSCIRMVNPGAMLRYCHETMLIPLICLLDINGYGLQTTDLEQLDRKGWRNYRIFPMATNVQFIFYRRNHEDKNVVFKVLLNEDEATLPLKTDMAPYYRWSDFRKYFLDKLSTYE